jgi:hypothetical protein
VKIRQLISKIRNLNVMAFSSVFDLFNLNGSNGFTINGINAYDSSGISVNSAGDVNEDGFDDLIIDARNVNPNGKNCAGKIVRN